MIFNGIIMGIFNVVDWLLTPLGNINWNLDVSFVRPLIEFFKVIYYLLPVNYLMPIFIVVFALMSFKLVIATLKTFMSIMPFI